MKAALHARIHLLLEPGGLGLPLRHRKTWHQVTVLEADIAAFGDQEGVVAGFRMIPEEMPHLVGGLQVELVSVEFEAVGIVERGRRLHAEECGMRGRVVRVCIVQVVGGDERQVELLRQAQQIGHRATFDIDAVIHHLGEEILGAEDISEVGCGFHRLVVLSEPQSGLHLTAHASGGRDNALRVP